MAMSSKGGMERYSSTQFILFSLMVNTYLARLLPKIEALVLVLHVFGFFCVLIPLVYLGPHESARDFFAQFTNAGGWSSDGLSFFIGLSTRYDAASHMAEEIETAPTVIPRSMLASVALNGTLGFSMALATLFCLRNAEDALATPTGFPFIQVFVNATGSKAGATAMVIP
ncbi:hypothetical protein MMC31_005337 [Peltigera leucophlebia]|nr:hypothetical protein [Peltigera leucophlebia]